MITVRFAEQAEDRLLQLRSHLLRSGFSISAFEAKLTAALQKVMRFPRLYRPVPEFGDDRFREFFVGTSRFCYVYDEERQVVLIAAIWTNTETPVEPWLPAL